MATGMHAVVVYDDPTGAGPAIDLSCLVTMATIRHGRDGTTGQPDASAATIDLDLRADPLPPEVEVGSVVKVTTTTGAGASVRFTGRITDLTLGWADAGPDTPDRPIGQLTAVGPLADLGRRVVGDAPWPLELDGARVSRILTAAGVTVAPINLDPGTVQLLARDVDSTAALSAAQDTAAQAGGILWESRAGAIGYADADHRRGATPVLTLDACDLLVTPTWRRAMDALINKISLGYGAPPAGGGEQTRVTASDAASQTTFGIWSYTADTDLATAAAATAMAQLLMVRNKTPPWILAGLPIYVDGLPAADYETLLALDMHSLISVTGLPVAGSAPTAMAMWVEGWTETLTYGTHDLELSVSSYCHTVPPPEWDDLAPTMTWDTVYPATLTWDQATCLGPRIDYGRWADVPASLHWDQVAPAVTWDSWTATPATAATLELIGA